MRKETWEIIKRSPAKVDLFQAELVIEAYEKYEKESIWNQAYTQGAIDALETVLKNLNADKTTETLEHAIKVYKEMRK